MKNCCYNVLHALTIEQRGLYAIKKNYLKDSKKDKHKSCDKMWRKVAKHKEAIVKELQKAAKIELK